MGTVGNNIGQKIRKARIEKKMTQEELANKDFNRSFLSQIEKGLVKPSDRVLSIIAERLNLPVSYFCEPEDPDKDDGDAIIALREAKHLFEQQNLEKAHEILSKTLKLQDISPKYAGLLLKLQGQLFFEESEIKKSLSSLKKAQIIFSDYKYHHELSATLNLMGYINNQIEQYDYAIHILQHAMRTIEDHFVLDTILTLNIYYNLAASYLGEKDYNTAISTIDEALPLSNHSNNYYNYGELNYLLGCCYKGIDNFTKSKQAFETAIDQFVIFNNYYYTGKSLFALAEIEKQKKNIELACRYFLKAYEEFKELNSTIEIEKTKLELLNLFLKKDDKDNILNFAPYKLEFVESTTTKITLSYHLTKVYHECGYQENCLIQLNGLNKMLMDVKRKNVIAVKDLIFYYSWMAHIYLYYDYLYIGKKCLKQTNSLLRKTEEQ
ncbi:helix-turn-helix domain-containing protein [Natranaerobius trueperi]|uniref:HTH cro/C1-type domain-containing protein n=1 Tax=Natranaerobius trueperi TaxID=759412 RepID=A0A226BXI8_9FIRM|nr:helix-turn-helix domain-containing protein [Natranaerobius trueperi]OWZ83631.1 hypothetical protein CDO51_07360 [Natranaerobius trueperi]